MNLLQQAAKIPDGIKKISDWLGAGGIVVDQNTAQDRANICLRCPHNKRGLTVTKVVALAVKETMSFKKKLKLRVNGEKRLHHCEVCSCVIRLMLWEPIGRIAMGLTQEEIDALPAHCWKLKEWKE